MSVLIETTLGDLVFDLYTEERPRSCMNFLKLCKMKYYNFCCFHSVRRNFIAQSGDPTETGRGGVSVYSILFHDCTDDLPKLFTGIELLKESTHKKKTKFVYGDQAKYFELELKPRIKHRTKGTISFVNNGNDMHGSQFFITLGDGLDFLDGKHTVFGQLAEGFDILEKLNEVICDDSHKPFQDVRITHTIVLEDPFDDPKGLPIPERSPEPTKEILESGRIAAGENINDDVSKEELVKKIEDKELAIGTKILETVGDIDDADLKPPENVLFVCKLNPVTNADDLKIIFSRFGKILSCEIIKDQKTGDSLCYGFVEFKEVEACEKAYFKMDNVLIDDRRIHVDFCQSVSKINKWRKSAAFNKLDSSKDAFGYEMKDKKNPKDKYSMIFDGDEEKKKEKNIKTESEVQERHQKKDSYNKSKKKSQRHRSESSESVSDDSSKSTDGKRSAVKKTSKSHKKRVDSRKALKRSYSSSDDDEDDTFKATAKKKKKETKKVLRKSSESDDSDSVRKSKKSKEASKYSDSDSEDKKSKKFQEELKKKKNGSSKLNRDNLRKNKDSTSEDEKKKKKEYFKRKDDRRSFLVKEKRDVRSPSQKEATKKTDTKEAKKYDSDELIEDERSKKKLKKLSLEECDTEEYSGEKTSTKKKNFRELADSDDSSDEDHKNKSGDFKKYTRRHSEDNKKHKKRRFSSDSSD